MPTIWRRRMPPSCAGPTIPTAAAKSARSSRSKRRWRVSMRRSPGAKASSHRPAPGLPRFELDGSTGRLKFNPLANWTRADLDAYFEAHDLPRHPLEVARLSVDRLLALHVEGSARRRPALGPLARLGQDRMRHPRSGVADRRRPGERSGVLHQAGRHCERSEAIARPDKPLSNCFASLAIRQGQLRLTHNPQTPDFRPPDR